MAETVKKKKTTPKIPTKTSGKTAKSDGVAVVSTNGASSNVTEITERPRKKQPLESQVPHDQIAQLAHRYWTERGGQHGYHLEDWYRAERELGSKAS